MSFWETSATFLAVVTPLVAVPLTALTFYLRSIREHQLTWQGEFVRRCDGVESLAKELRRAFGEFERDCVTKEEWLRECMHARRTLERLTEVTAGLDATVKTLTLGASVGRPTGAGDVRDVEGTSIYVPREDDR